jgi:antitoxin component YwqK of YwqJK toxin-antitoxin module
MYTIFKTERSTYITITGSDMDMLDEYSEDGAINKEGFYIDGKLSGSYTEYLENGAFYQS